MKITSLLLLNLIYVTQSTQIVQQCHYSCSTCSGPSSDQCQTCSSLNNRIFSSSQCPCMSGYIENVNSPNNTQSQSTCIINPNAIICLPQCHECINTTQCTSCDSFMVLYNSYCVCVDGYFATNTGCRSCNLTCKTCFGSQSNQCGSCAPDRILSSAGTCTCISGMYNLNGICTCIIFMYNRDCPIQYQYDSTQSMCLLATYLTCPNGTYYNQYYGCSKCFFTCATCSDKYTCQTCTSGNTMDGLATLCTSKPGFYTDYNSVTVSFTLFRQKNYITMYTCTTQFCQSPSCPAGQESIVGVCVSCPNYDIAGSCVLSCPIQLPNCQLCSDEYTCKRCYYPYSIQQNCITTFGCLVINNEISQCQICSTGFYASGLICLPCPKCCDYCSVSQCFQCSSGCNYDPITSGCVTSTPTMPNCLIASGFCTQCLYGYYQQTTNGPCLPTNNQLCKHTTINSMSCSSCADGYCLVLNSQCDNTLSALPPGCSYCGTDGKCTMCKFYYKLDTNNNCNFSPNCLTWDTSHNYCTTCSLPYILSPSNNCYINYATCIQCTKSGRIATCQPLLLLSNGDCYACNGLQCLAQRAKTCLYGYRGMNCLLNAFKINSCYQPQPYIIINGQQNCKLLPNSANMSACTCNRGYYQWKFKCLPCSIQCLSCILNRDNCIKCSSVQRINPPVCGLRSLYYVTNRVVKLCALKCMSCDQNGCISCSNNTYSPPQCVPTCTSVQYLSPTLTCLNCSIQCLYCKYTSSNCIVCANLMNPPACLCSLMTYANGNSCTACSPVCNSCLQSSTGCTTCSTNRSKPTNCNCNDGYFSNSDAPCQRCSYQCLKCQNTSTTCTTCGPFRQIQPDCLCLDGYYDMQGIAACQPCHASCLTCYGNSQSQCLTCNIKDYRQLSANNQCDCLDGFYDDGGTCRTCSIVIFDCQPQICGDKLLTPLEQCDDGNQLSYDGCSSTCKLEPYNYYCTKVKNPDYVALIFYTQCTACITHCRICTQYICEAAQDGYYLSNNIPYACDKHCATCSGPSQQECITCATYDYGFLAKCAFCNETIGLYANGPPPCVSKCGDAILLNEDCDDGNLVNNDGCSSLCQLEFGFSCINQYLSKTICQKITYPSAVIKPMTGISLYTMKRNYAIVFSEALLIGSEYISDIVINIPDINNDMYDVNSVVGVGSDAIYQIQFTIELLQSTTDAIIIVQFPSNRTVFGLLDGIQFYQTNCTYNSPAYYSVGPGTQTIFSYTKYITYLLLGIISIIAVISLILGDLSCLWNILDVFQQLNYVQQINILQPQILIDYINVFSWAQTGTITNYLTLTSVNQYLQQLQAKTQVPTSGLSSVINSPFYMTNIQPLVILWVQTLAIYYLALTIESLFRKTLYALYYLGRTATFPMLYRKYRYYQILKSVYNMFKEYSQNFYYVIILRVYISSFYDLNSAVFITIYYAQLGMSSSLANIEQLIAFVNLALIMVSILWMARSLILSKTSYFKTKLNEQRFSPIYEGYKVHIHYRILAIAQILRKQIFIIALTNLFDYPQYQLITLLGLHSLFTILQFVISPQETIVEKIKSNVIESVQTLSMLLFSLYYLQSQYDILDLSTFNAIGIFHVVIYTLLIMFNVSIDAQHIIKTLMKKSKYRKYFSSEQKQPELKLERSFFKEVHI